MRPVGRSVADEQMNGEQLRKIREACPLQGLIPRLSDDFDLCSGKLLNTIIESCVVIDFDLRFKFVNDAVVQHGHVTREELLGRTVADVNPGIVDGEAYYCLRDCMESRISHRFETKITHHDGTICLLDIRFEPVPHGVMALFLNIRAREVTAQGLQEALREPECTATHELLDHNSQRLTPRELTVLRLVVAGETDRIIGSMLEISRLTVQKHISNIHAKLGVSSRTAAAVMVVRERLID